MPIAIAPITDFNGPGNPLNTFATEFPKSNNFVAIFKSSSPTGIRSALNV